MNFITFEHYLEHLYITCSDCANIQNELPQTIRLLGATEPQVTEGNDFSCCDFNVDLSISNVLSTSMASGDLLTTKQSENIITIAQLADINLRECFASEAERDFFMLTVV